MTGHIIFSKETVHSSIYVEHLSQNTTKSHEVTVNLKNSQEIVSWTHRQIKLLVKTQMS